MVRVEITPNRGDLCRIVELYRITAQNRCEQGICEPSAHVLLVGRRGEWNSPANEIRGENQISRAAPSTVRAAPAHAAPFGRCRVVTHRSGSNITGVVADRMVATPTSPWPNE